MYKHIAVGGTFDRLHKGHKHFLTHVFASGARVTIGLTSQRYIKNHKSGKGVSPYSKRYQTLITWLRHEGYAARAVVIPLHDPYGPAVLSGEFDAIAVTRDNERVGREINTKRQEVGLTPLALVTVDLLAAEDSHPISSTRVRNREIDREGHFYLPSSLRQQLAQPLGKLSTGDEIQEAIVRHNDDVTITIGDITTHTFFAHGVQPSLAIIDLHVNRKPYQTFEAYKFPKKYEVKRVSSGPGYISKAAIQAIKDWSTTVRVRKRMVIVVDGEEDLLAIPAIIHAPVGAVVFYGQPKGALWACGPEFRGGVVAVSVTPEQKKEAIALLNKFTVD